MSDSPCPLGCGLSGLHSTLDCATRRGAPYEGDAGGACARLRADLAALRVEVKSLAAENVQAWVDAHRFAAERDDARMERDHLEALLEDEDAYARRADARTAAWARGLTEGLARGVARAERAEARVGALWRALEELRGDFCGNCCAGADGEPYDESEHQHACNIAREALGEEPSDG